MENYDKSDANGYPDQGDQHEQEPSGAAAHGVAGLGDAEGAVERGREGLKESHDSMVRRACWREAGDAKRWSRHDCAQRHGLETGARESWLPNPGRRRGIQ